MNFILQSFNRNLKGFKSSIRGGSAFLFGGLLLSNAIAFGYLMVLARLMSPEEYGTLVTLTSISYVLTIVMRTIQAWVIKTISANRKYLSGQLQSVFIIGMRALIPVGVILVVGNWLLGSWFASFIHLRNVTPVIMLSFYIFSSFLAPVVRGILLGLNRLYSASLLSIIEALGRLLAGVALVSWGFGVNGAVTGYTIGNLVAFAFGLITLWSILLRPRDTAFSKFRLEGLNSYAVLVFFINVCLMIMMSIDQIAVKHFFSEQIAGNYAIAFLIGRVISMSTVALGWVVFTRSTALIPHDPSHVRVLIKALALTGIFSVVIMGGCLLAPNLIVHLMGGSKFNITDDYLAFVTIEMTLFAFINIQVYYHISLNRTEAIWPLLLSVGLVIFLLAQYHATVQQILVILISVMGGLLVSVSGVTWWILHSHDSFKSIVVSESSHIGTDN
jgi:O-antigen/teichoic acid export membrane protein